MNPFTPTFGIVPPFLAGRTNILSMMHRAFDNFPGDPNLSSIIIGPRGSGKTALLNCIGDEAKNCGWLVVDAMCGPGMLEDILQHTYREVSNVVQVPEHKHLTGVQIGQLLGLEWTIDTEKNVNWRIRMESLTKILKENDTGLLITVDEVRADESEMIRFASVYQMLRRSGSKIALVMAGLPSNVNELLMDKSVSFLRRARQQYLSLISDVEIERAFKKTVESGGKIISADALTSAVQAISGFPYMMQLVGYSMWEVSADSHEITSGHANEGIVQARSELKNGVLKSTYLELSKGDRSFLKAMLADKESSTLTDIAGRIKKSNGYAYTYKVRMLKAGIIEEEPGNKLIFAIPFFREYLEEMENMYSKTEY